MEEIEKIKIELKPIDAINILSMLTHLKDRLKNSHDPQKVSSIGFIDSIDVFFAQVAINASFEQIDDGLSESNLRGLIHEVFNKF